MGHYFPLFSTFYRTEIYFLLIFSGSQKVPKNWFNRPSIGGRIPISDYQTLSSDLLIKFINVKICLVIKLFCVKVLKCFALIITERESDKRKKNIKFFFYFGPFLVPTQITDVSCILVRFQNDQKLASSSGLGGTPILVGP